MATSGMLRKPRGWRVSEWRLVREAELTGCGSEMNGNVNRPAYGRRVHELDLALVDVPAWEPSECLFDRDARFEPGEVGTEAVMRSEAEGDVTVEGAGNVETIGFGVLAIVTPGAPGEQRDLRFGG